MRYLLTIPSGTAVDSLELAVVDLLENVKSLDEWERSILEQLRDLMRTVRVGEQTLQSGTFIHRHEGPQFVYV